MKLTKINYSSATFIGVLALIFQVISGIVQVVIDNAVPGYFQQLGITVVPINMIIYTPIIVSIIVYIVSLLAIWVYNNVAKKHPIAWEVK